MEITGRMNSNRRCHRRQHRCHYQRRQHRRRRYWNLRFRCHGQWYRSGGLSSNLRLSDLSPKPLFRHWL
jgi:hypothetical protein